jgi:probable rRNA maturation factor
LHLLGYDHENDEDRVIMRVKEEEILNELGLYR